VSDGWALDRDDDVDVDLDDDVDVDDDEDLDDLVGDDLLADVDPARARALAAEMAEVRAKLAEVPASQVVANHAMGLFELAAIHLSQAEPLLSEAALAIDAMGAIVEGVGADRLGEAGPTLVEALSQIRLAFVQVKSVQAL
jgi:hypothetical protein